MFVEVTGEKLVKGTFYPSPLNTNISWIGLNLSALRRKVIFTLLYGATKCFMKTFKTFIKSFEAPQRIVKIKIKVNLVSFSEIQDGKS